MYTRILFYYITLCIVMGCSSRTSLDSFQLNDENSGGNAVTNTFTFNGYTNYWQNVYSQQYRYGNLFRINRPDLEKTILQSKVDIAESLGVTGLQMQEGFFNGLVDSPYMVLDHPSVDELQNALGTANHILVFTSPESETGKIVKAKNNRVPSCLNSNQTKAADYSEVEAFVLKSGNKSLHVVTGTKKDQLEVFKTLILNAEQVLKAYDLKRGWFGVETLIKSVTCTPGNPIDVIGKGMNEGNSWFVFSGYMEFLAKEKIENWVKEVQIPVVTDVGFSPVFGCEDYNGLQVQSMFERDSWLKFAREKKGYLFRALYNVSERSGRVNDNEGLDFDGYFVNVGNARQLNQGDKPFVSRTGSLIGGTVNSMILFNRKGDPFNRKKLWEAIMDRRAVAIEEGGVIIGPDTFRKAMQLLLLDRVYIEDYFGDKVNLNAFTEGHRLHVKVCNLYAHPIKGSLTVKLPEQLTLAGNQTVSLQLPANSSKDLVFEINPSAKAMEKLNAIEVRCDWENSSKSIVASLDLPPAISVHQLLYGVSSGLPYPVAIHNFTNEKEVNVKVKVIEKDNPSKVVYADEKSVSIEKGNYRTLNYDLRLNPGHYTVITEAMGVTASTQLGIEGNTGTATLTVVDLNKDGINEYVMENEHVRATLLTAGARVIEYMVKARNSNVFFKLWPDKPVDVDRPFRERGFYPYGGFEDFLGQASVETHKVYDAEVIKKEGNVVQVKMIADYFGNKIEKIFTLYGNSPLLEVRFALNMINPELNVLGPQPILELGKSHGVEDHFFVPEMDGLHKYVMMPDKMYGRVFYLKEGWNSGYDTKEDVSFVGAFPVKRPYFLHMWMNLTANTDSHYDYAEFQPWLPLFTHTTSYFSYYMWAAAGPWEKGLQALRDRNLITSQ